jgi:hypothetical protein
MKTLTKSLAVIAALTFSIGVFAHMGPGNGRMGFGHPMFDTDRPQYQAMLEKSGNPEAMQAWIQTMHENPEVMHEWMEQMHANYKGSEKYERFGCHGHWQIQDNSEATE